MSKPLLIAGMCAILAACSSTPKQDEKKSSPALQSVSSSTASKNPAAKYIELVGFRVKEKGPGNLDVSFGVVNHSEADLGDLTLEVNLRTTTAKPDEPPVCTFTVKVPSLGPEEMKPLSAVVPSKLRVYELPDWQFLKADFAIIEPK
jgi:hypothetical protein